MFVYIKADVTYTVLRLPKQAVCDFIADSNHVDRSTLGHKASDNAFSIVIHFPAQVADIGGPTSRDSLVRWISLEKHKLIGVTAWKGKS